VPQTEEELSLEESDTDIDKETLSPESTETMLTRRLPSTVVPTEMSETMVTSALMFLVVQTPTTEMLFGTNATTAETKDGGSTQLLLTSQDIHSEMESSSRSRV